MQRTGSIELSVLDQVSISQRHTATRTFDSTLQLALAAEALEYRRVWFGELHSMRNRASSAPEIVMARVAAATHRIRVGSGALLLRKYSPLKVAEVYRTLQALFPNRVDLGIGRSDGTPDAEIYRCESLGIAPDESDDLELRIRELKNLLCSEAGSPNSVYVSPPVNETNHLWLLGSSVASAILAGTSGLAFAYAQFINPFDAEQAVSAYKASFVPSEAGQVSAALIAVGALCAHTSVDAAHLFTSTALSIRRMALGDYQPLEEPSIAQAELAAKWSGQTDIEASGRYVVGSATEVASKITRLARQAGVPEVMILTHAYSQHARIESFKMLREALE